MHTKQALIDQYRKAAQRMRDLADAAFDQKRDFTSEENAEVAALRSVVDGLRPKIEKAARDEKVNAAVRDLGIGGGGTSAVVANTRLKALGDSNWGNDLVRTQIDSFGRFKSLTPSGTVVVSVPVAPEPVRLGEPVVALRQLIPTEPDPVGAWDYFQQSLRDNQAAVVARGARKPASQYTMERKQVRAATIAHLTDPIPRQDLSDAPKLTSFVDEELRLGLELALENEIINGDGTGDRFAGLNTVSGTQSQAWATDLLTTTRQAVTKLEVLSLNASGWVFHPSDWERIELAANTNGYLLAQAGQALPVDRAARRLWSVPVALSTSVTAGVGWLADFAGSTQLKIREEAVIDWSENTYDPDALGVGDGATDFERNMIRFRAEMRAGFAVTRPAGVVKLDLTA